MQIDGARVLLTGATGGLGRAIAAELAGRGATMILSSRSAAELGPLAAGLPGGAHRAIALDLAVPGAAVELVELAGEFDVLVANAGVPGGPALEGADPELIERVARINLEVPMLMAAVARPGMVERGTGHMVFISSLAGKAIPSGSALYAATKAGLRAFALGLRGDLHGSGVSASVISPGFVREAGMFHDSGARVPSVLGTASPADVGRAVAAAIEGDRGEIDVAPPQQRAFVGLAFHFHGLGKRLERAFGGRSLAERVAEGRAAQGEREPDAEGRE